MKTDLFERFQERIHAYSGIFMHLSFIHVYTVLLQDRECSSVKEERHLLHLKYVECIADLIAFSALSDPRFDKL